MARPLCVCAVAYIDGLMHDCMDIIGAKPCGGLAQGWRVGVIEVMARGKDFDGTRAAGSEGIQQAGLEAMLKEDVGKKIQVALL